MSESVQAERIVTASSEVAAPSARIFELIANPTQQPRWDGNDNLVRAVAGKRVTAVGDVFDMALTNGAVRENHVVEFEEGRQIAWLPSEPGSKAPGHLWRWEIEPLDEQRSRVIHTYDWTDLTDENRIPRAQATTSDKLMASVRRLAALAESD